MPFDGVEGCFSLTGSIVLASAACPAVCVSCHLQGAASWSASTASNHSQLCSTHLGTAQGRLPASIAGIAFVGTRGISDRIPKVATGKGQPGSLPGRGAWWRKLSGQSNGQRWKDRCLNRLLNRCRVGPQRGTPTTHA